MHHQRHLFVQEEDLLDPQDNDEVVAILQASGTLVAMNFQEFPMWVPAWFCLWILESGYQNNQIITRQ